MGKGPLKTEATEKQRAFGRSLSDFPDLNDAEKELVGATRAGRFARIGVKVPETEEEKKKSTIRAGLVRFLVLGGDDITPVHEQGVQLRGAVIEGSLDLDSCTLVGDLYLWNCDLTAELILRGARARTVNLAGSRSQGIIANRCQFSGGLYLQKEFAAKGTVYLQNAVIVGPLSLDNARLEGRDEDGEALSCDRMQVSGSVLCSGTIVSKGSIRLHGSTISGSLTCSNARFEGQNNHGTTLQCDAIHVGDDIFFEGLVASGMLNLIGATVGGDVVCTRGTFGAPTTSPQEEKDTSALIAIAPQKRVLTLSRSTIKGTLWLSGENSKFYGGVSLAAASVARVVDAVKNPRKEATTGDIENPSFLRLDGLTYDRFGENTDVTAAARIAFLRLQHSNDQNDDFKPHPWIQMVKVLRDSGHVEAAREVAIAYEDARRRAGVISGGIARFLHRLYGLLVGYGHRPMQLLRITFCLWLICAAVYFTAAELGVMAPTNPRVFDEPKHASCRPENGGNWTTCDKAPYEYTTFNPWIYSLDLMLPFVDLQQDRDWAPMMMRPCAVTKSIWVTDICWRSAVVAKVRGEPVASIKPAYWISGTIVAAVMWFEILFGWAASLLLAAVLSGLAKRME